MNPNMVTLQDVAEVLQVSATTVHRALTGKEGVGEKLRRRIQTVAAEMGYRGNYMAAALGRKPKRLAIAFPEPASDNRYYYLSLWTGARRFLQEVDGMGLQTIEIAYPLQADSTGSMLQDVYEHRLDDIDALLAPAFEHPKTAYFLEKLHSKGLPVVLVGADLYPDHRLCAVTAYNEAAGRMAAELITAFHDDKTPRNVIITANLTGDLANVDQHHNARGFEQYMEEHAAHITLLPAYTLDAPSAYIRIKELLSAHDVYAIYSCNARHTIHMCRAATELGLEGTLKLVGNDSFQESVSLLQQGVLTAIVDKKIARQSYLGAKTLFDYVVKGEYPSGNTIRIVPEIILNSNCGLI